MRAWRIALSGLVLCSAVAAASAETINATPENLASILERVNPGDTVVCADGVYGGGFTIARSGTEAAPIVLKAAGSGCVFEGGADCLRIEAASYVTVEGIRFQHAERCGIFPAAPPAEPATHVTIRRCVFAENGFPGVMSGHINHLTIEDCEAYGGVRSHGLYVSNSGDYPVVRGNRIHNNVKCGLHMNGDPEMGGDGVISFALVENNRIWENGKPAGGSAINVTHVQDSIFRNNLAYNNYAGGIITYYDTGGDACASKRNKIVNNTVVFRPGEGKWALALKRNSTGAFVQNNVLVGGKYAAIGIEESSREGLMMDYNVIATYPGQQFGGDSTEGTSVSEEEWRKLGYDAHSSIGRMPQFENAEAGDFRLAAGSAGVDAGADLKDLVLTDIDGNVRPRGEGFDCGCFERSSGEKSARRP